MRTETKRLLRACGAALLMMTVIFAGLYFRYLSGQYLYAYKDIGYDTIDTYLPNIIFDLRGILSGNLGQYVLGRGLGEFYYSNLCKYLNPLNLPLLLFGEEHLNWGLTASLYLKNAALCVFSLLFFRRLLRDDRPAVLCALLWTYSGYAVLWGQHYDFLTSMVVFTISMYGLQLFLDGDRKRFLLIPALTFLIMRGYYWIYMSCFFFAVYSVLLLAFRGTRARDILKKAGQFALSLMAAAALSGVSLLPSLVDFFSSSRTAGLSTGSQWLIYPKSYLISFVARLLSNNTMGVCNSYIGPANYYEIAVLSVSALFVFSLVLLLQTGQWKRVLFITLGCSAALCLPIVSQLLTFSSSAQRWTYLLCFAQVILIGLALRHLFAHCREPAFRPILLRTVLISDGLYLLALAFLGLAKLVTFFNPHLITIGIFLVVTALYSGFFLLLPRWNRRWSVVLLACLICFELVSSNYATIYFRRLVSTEDWYGSMYYDGTEEAVQWIKAQDGGLYRVGKTYSSVGYNDQLVQDFNGTAIYDSTNASELIELFYSLKNTSPSDNFIRFSAASPLQNALLGVKYVIAGPEDSLNPALYRQVYETEDHIVYENIYWTGFGYLYDQEISRTAYALTSTLQWEETLLQAFYYTDETQTVQPRETQGLLLETLSLDLCGRLTGSAGCSASAGETLSVTPVKDKDGSLFFSGLDIPEGYFISGLRTVVTSQEDTALYIYLSDENGLFSEESCGRLDLQAGTNIYEVDFNQYSSRTGLRFDLDADSQSFTFESLQLILEPVAENTALYQRLQENSIQDAAFEDNTFTGSITNPGREEAMLCIPLVYSDNWTATVDGVETGYYNINGGLIGIPLSPGDHEISLTYRDNIQQTGLGLTLVTLGCYLAGAALWWFRKGRKEPVQSLVPDAPGRDREP